MRLPKARTALRSMWTIFSLFLLIVCGLSTKYNFGLVRVVPYPGGHYAPIETNVIMTAGGLLFFTAQGNTPYSIGLHGVWYRHEFRFSWKPEIYNGWLDFTPGWPLVVLTTGATVGLWCPVVLRRLRRKGFECACGYDRRGLRSGAKCPECGSSAD